MNNMSKDPATFPLFTSSENFLDLMVGLVQKLGQDSWYLLFWLDKMDICVELCWHTDI